MKKLFLLIVFSIIIYCHNSVIAQNLSIEETKTILCSHKWVLKRLEKDNKMIAVSKGLQGLKMVFKTDGYAYQFLPSELESDKAGDPFKWSITKTTLTIDIAAGNRRVSIYSLKDVAGMKLFMTLDEVGESAFVYEQAEKTEDFTKYEVDDLWSTPELDSSMKELAARINKDMAYYKIIVGSWNLEKISFKNIVTKSGDSYDAYTSLYKKALLDTIKEVKVLTEVEKNQLDLDALTFSLVYFGSGLDFKEDNKLSFRLVIGSVLGRYRIAYGSLIVNLDNGNEDNFEIVKITSKEAELKDKKLKVTYYYKRNE